MDIRGQSVCTLLCICRCAFMHVLGAGPQMSFTFWLTKVSHWTLPQLDQVSWHMSISPLLCTIPAFHMDLGWEPSALLPEPTPSPQKSWLLIKKEKHWQLPAFKRQKLHFMPLKWSDTLPPTVKNTNLPVFLTLFLGYLEQQLYFPQSTS